MIIQNIKRTGAVADTFGAIKLDGMVTMEAAAPKVVGFNFTIFVNTAPANEAECFVYAGSVSNDGSFNMNLQPDYVANFLLVANSVCALIADVEASDATPKSSDITIR